MCKAFEYKGFRIYPFETPQVDDIGYGKYNPVYKWYFQVKDTKIKFTSVRDAKEWCSRTRLYAIVQGWI